MSSCSSSARVEALGGLPRHGRGGTAALGAEARHARLRATATFREGAHARWAQGRIAVVGCGNLGARLATEAVRSGASVWLCDPDRGEEANLGTQPVASGVSKAAAVRDACEAIQGGRSSAAACDVLHAGVAELARSDLIADCTDDPRLAWPLTLVSNGLRVPLLRLALDGSGERELGRALLSHGGGGHACQVCPWSPEDLFRAQARTPCPGSAPRGPAPTKAGGALGMAVAGLGLLQAQRVVGGNDRHLAVGREVLLDLSALACVALELRRSERCLSGHEGWHVTRVARRAEELRAGELLEIARRELGGAPASLEPFAHPLCAEAACACGARVAAAGTRWAPAPDCPACGRATAWVRELTLPRFDAALAAELGILGRTLVDLGLPESGALVAARAAGGAGGALHLLLD